MFKQIHKILTDTCRVVKIKDNFYYPIFKNASSALNIYATKNSCEVLINEEIEKLNHIIVFVRDPNERFVSGLLSAIAFNKKKDLKEYLDAVETEREIDKHFVPQYIWLCHLYKYFKGTVELRHFSEVTNLVGDNGIRPPIDTPHPRVARHIENMKKSKYIDIDIKIIEAFINVPVKLRSIVDHKYQL